ncbi:MAG: flagellar protein export ATPase FliI [Armatimonadetes bacterium]|nr:flagellar protein export ATPase FliI [Armatimonadota bacterium]
MIATRPALDLEKYREAIRKTDTVRANGRVAQVIGVLVESCGPECGIGEICEIHNSRTEPPVLAEVVGFREKRTLLMPYSMVNDVRPGSPVVAQGSSLRVPVGQALLGRVLDGLGRPLDGLGPILNRPSGDRFPGRSIKAAATPPHPLERQRIHDALSFGVRAIDGLLTIGKGQRIGIFSGSGVGKSILMGMIARNTSADVNVIALIGERGREVRDFLEKDLGPEGLARSVVIVATSDQVPVVRLRGAQVATGIAEYFRDCGKDVILMMDSVTRVAWAQREIGLASGEPPTTRGYTPSVFAVLPQLLERAGTSEKGSITGLYTVLVEGDDMNEPVADTVRGILDGHIVLSRDLAARNHYPAIDILSSVSRLMVDVTTKDHRRSAGMLREVLATYKSSEDLINIGAYAHGSNPSIDFALSKIDDANAFLKQSVDERSDFNTTSAALTDLFGDNEAL